MNKVLRGVRILRGGQDDEYSGHQLDQVIDNDEGSKTPHPPHLPSHITDATPAVLRINRSVIAAFGASALFVRRNAE
jgi:hypothetical protein